MASISATPISSSTDLNDGPVLSLINKRIRSLKKKQNRIVQMEESLSQGKILEKEQEETLKSKQYVFAAIEELEKLRLPLSSAVSEEIQLALQKNTTTTTTAPVEGGDVAVDDVLNLLYFGTMFDVKPQSDFAATTFTKTHERGCCLTYDYVTDDDASNDLMLNERDLDLISMLGGLLISRPVDSSLSHKNALQRCIEHAKLWISKSERPIGENSGVTYAGLREKLKKIMASDYFTTTPEMKAPVEVAAAASVNYGSFEVPVLVEEDSVEQYHQQEEEDAANFHGNEAYDNQSSPVEELHKGELEVESPEEVPGQTDSDIPQADVGQNSTDVEAKEQEYVPRRTYQNHRGGRGVGGRRGYPNGRGGRGGIRGVGAYQNGRHQYYDQTTNYYPRNYYNPRGRSSRGAGGNSYGPHGSADQADHAAAGS